MQIFRKTSLFIVLLSVNLAWPVTAELSHAAIQQNDQGLGLGGYSPVSYFQRNKAEKGVPAFEAMYEGVRYYLTDVEQLALFNADPQRYLPAHGGWCSLMLSGSGNLTPANPESYKIIDDRLLLFWSGDYKGQAISGLSNWHSKTDGKAKKETKRLLKANRAWEKIQKGKSEPHLLVFSPQDDNRLNASQRAAAKKQY
ncbi:YHS domain-containing (seleno)protein [Marinicella sp. W31]|uniref:YHS domain-containing (seleno)protein n=1 Tax=Marinicella sp. W31 TaxID=3023713 RepID=UPI003756FEF0